MHCIFNGFYWFICMLLSLIILFPIGVMLYCITSIAQACIPQCSSFAKLFLDWIQAPGVCAKNACDGATISCNCI